MSAPTDHWRSVTAAAGLALLLAGGPRIAAAQGVPVMDVAAIAEASDSLKAATQQVEQLNALLGEVQQMVNTVGRQGRPAVAFEEALSASGISQFAPPVEALLSSVQASATTVQSAVSAGRQMGGSLQRVLAQADRLKGSGNTSSSTAPDFSSFVAAQSWVRNELTVGQGANVTAVNLTRRARSMLAGEATLNAYAMALNARQQLRTLAGRTQRLAQQAATATDLRGDLAANTAVMLAMHDELAEVQALMAAVLEVQSASRLAEMDPLASSSITVPASSAGPSAR